MEVNDYYKVLGLRFKFTELGLLKSYFKTAKIALSNNNKEEFVKARMGFEVLRNESVVQEYNRIYRKYILKEKLNFPLVREQQMLITFQAREAFARHEAAKAIERHETYRIHLLKFLLSFIFVDLFRIFQFGKSGLLFMSVGFYTLYNFHDLTNLIGGASLILFGIYLFRRNIILEISE